MVTMDPLRCVGLKQALLSDDGKAVLLELAMANGKIFPLELEAGGVDLLARALLMSAQAMGPSAATPATLAERDPAQAVQVAPDALQVRERADGQAALLLRVGALDLSVQLADPAALAAQLPARG